RFILAAFRSEEPRFGHSATDAQRKSRNLYLCVSVAIRPKVARVALDGFPDACFVPLRLRGTFLSKWRAACTERAGTSQKWNAVLRHSTRSLALWLHARLSPKRHPGF